MHEKKKIFPPQPIHDSFEGILLLDKPKGHSSFWLVYRLRRLLNVKKIGHAGTLDPFATGLMVMLVGRKYTRLSDTFLTHDKEYVATARLGVTTDSYDCTGKTIASSEYVPTLDEIEQIIEKDFTGHVWQTPPMFSAKKQQGKKLYELARKGVEVERPAVQVHMQCTIIDYHYPHLTFKVTCSKGTYIRSIAHDLGQKLGCGAHLEELRRTRSGQFLLENAISIDTIEPISHHLIHISIPLEVL